MSTRLEQLSAWLLPGFLLQLGLRARFMVMAAAAIVAFGVANLIVFDAIAARVMEEEVRDRAMTLSQRLADTADRLVLLDDRAGLRRALEVTRRTDPLCDYALVIASDGHLLASTFRDGVPEGLVEANRPGGAAGSISTVSDRGVHYLDVAAPMLDGELGVVRIGAKMDRVYAGVAKIREAALLMVGAFLLIGLIGAYLTANLIVSPVERLADEVQRFDPAEPDEHLRTLSPATGEVGELIRSFELMRVRLRQLHRDRQAFQDRILQAERLATVGALAAGVAHEVNNPLAGLRNCLQAIAREPEDIEQTREYARMMVAATRTIERVVSGLIDVAARAQPEPTATDLSALASNTIPLVRHRFRTSRVKLDVLLPEGLSAIHTDEGLLRQVLVNLLINACDASPVGATVTLSARLKGELVVLEVIDEGSGIPPEVADRLFQPFVTTKADRGGTGLGLAMVKAIVSDLGGLVTFETQVGEGTRFTVKLPVHAGEFDAEAGDAGRGAIGGALASGVSGSRMGD